MVRRFIAAVLVAGSLFAAGLALAPATAALDIPCQSDNAGQCDLVKGENLAKTNTISKIVDWALGILGSIAVLMMVIAGFLYVTSQGDSTKLVTAKHTILYTIIGLAIAIFAGVAIKFIISVFK